MSEPGGKNLHHMDWLCAPRVVGRAAAWYLSSRLQAIQAVQKMTLGIEPPQDRSGIHHPFATRFYLFYPQFWGVSAKALMDMEKSPATDETRGSKMVEIWKRSPQHPQLCWFCGSQSFATLKSRCKLSPGRDTFFGFTDTLQSTAEGLKKSWDPQGSPSHDVMVVSGMIWDDDWGTYITGNRNIICCCDLV